MHVVRQALRHGRVHLHGQRWTFDDVPVTPSPRRAVPLLVGAVSRPALRRAVRLGDGVLVYCGTPADHRARFCVLDEVLAERNTAGTPESTRHVARVCTGILHVAEDPDQAWAEAAPGIAYLEHSIAAYSETGAHSDPWSTADIERSDYLVGPPGQVADRLADLHADIGFDHFAHWARLPGLSHTRAMESLHLVASALLPAVQQRIAHRVP